MKKGNKSTSWLSFPFSWQCQKACSNAVGFRDENGNCELRKTVVCGGWEKKGMDSALQLPERSTVLSIA